MVDLISGGDKGLTHAVIGGGVDDGEFAGAAGGAGQGVEDRLGN